jgi:hypothetical protein
MLHMKFMIAGTRVVKIKEFIDHSQSCPDCKAFELRVKVFRAYQHWFFIPFVAFGDKQVEIRCNQCTEPVRTEALKKQHAKNTGTPFYLYTLAILLSGLLGSLLLVGFITQMNTRRYIANPQTNDVYLVHSEKEGRSHYYYLRVVTVSGDTVVTLKNNNNYSFSPEGFSSEDYFVTDHLVYYTKAALKEMFEKDEITVAKRDYDSEEGFNREHERFIENNEW